MLEIDTPSNYSYDVDLAREMGLYHPSRNHLDTSPRSSHAEKSSYERASLPESPEIFSDMTPPAEYNRWFDSELSSSSASNSNNRSPKKKCTVASLSGLSSVNEYRQYRLAQSRFNFFVFDPRLLTKKDFAMMNKRIEF